MGKERRSMKTRRVLIFSMFVVALLVGGCGLSLWQAKRQYTLNRQLITALIKGDSKQALTLVNAGADPNTRVDASPVPSVSVLINSLLHHSPPHNDSPTALMLACGSSTFAETLDEGEPAAAWYKTTGNPHLIKAMLVRKIDIDAQDDMGLTALWCAVESSRSKEVIKRLLDYGSNPGIPANNGSTASDIAEEDHRTDIVVLLRKYRK